MKITHFFKIKSNILKVFENHCYILLFWSFHLLEKGKMVKSGRQTVGEEKLGREVRKRSKTQLRVTSWAAQFWLHIYKRTEN